MRSNKKYIAVFLIVLSVFFILFYSFSNTSKDVSSFIKNSLKLKKGQNAVKSIVLKGTEIKGVHKEKEGKNSLEFEVNFLRDLESTIRAFENFKNSERSFPETYQFLKDIGAEPGIAVENVIGEIVFSGTKAVGPMRYFKVKYDTEGDPSWFVFEIEPGVGMYKKALKSLKDNYSKNLIFCGENEQMTVFKDGEFIVYLRRVGEKDIEEGSSYKPRSKDDLGSIEVRLEYDMHPTECGGENL